MTDPGCAWVLRRYANPINSFVRGFCATDVTHPTRLPPSLDKMPSPISIALHAVSQVRLRKSYERALNLVIRVETGDHLLTDIAAFFEIDQIQQSGFERVDVFGQIKTGNRNFIGYSDVIEKLVRCRFNLGTFRIESLFPGLARDAPDDEPGLLSCCVRPQKQHNSTLNHVHPA